MQREAASHVCRVYAFVGVADYAVIHAAFCCMAWPEQLAWRALFAQRFRPARAGLLATANSKQAASASLRMAFVLHRRKRKRASRIKLPKQRVQRIGKRALHLLASILDIRLTIDLGLADAAQTALACGALTAMLGQVPCLHYLRMLPQYAQGEQLHVRGNCILFCRLGKLLLIAVLFILYARQKAGGARDAGIHSSHQRRYADGA